MGRDEVPIGLLVGEVARAECNHKLDIVRGSDRDDDAVRYSIYRERARGEIFRGPWGHTWPSLGVAKFLVGNGVPSLDVSGYDS